MAIPHVQIGFYEFMKGNGKETNRLMTFFKSADGQFLARIITLTDGLVENSDCIFSEDQMIVLMRSTQESFNNTIIRQPFASLEDKQEVFQLLQVLKGVHIRVADDFTYLEISTFVENAFSAISKY